MRSSEEIAMHRFLNAFMGAIFSRLTTIPLPKCSFFIAALGTRTMAMEFHWRSIHSLAIVRLGRDSPRVWSFIFMGVCASTPVHLS